MSRRRGGPLERRVPAEQSRSEDSTKARSRHATRHAFTTQNKKRNTGGETRVKKLKRWQKQQIYRRRSTHLDLLDHCDLFINGQEAMEDTDATVASHGDGHLGLADLRCKKSR